jgi:TolB protein
MLSQQPHSFVRPSTLLWTTLALIALILLTAAPPADAQSAVTATIKGATVTIRSGPGTTYPPLGAAKKGEKFDVKGKNADGSWLQVCCFKSKTGWVAASLVTVKGDLKTISVVKDIAPAPAVAAAPAKGGKPSGVIWYSALNRDKEQWELWEYSFATGKSRFLKEWRTEVSFSKDFKQVLLYAWPPAVGGADKAGIYAANLDLSGERLVIDGGAYPSFGPGGNRLSLQGGDAMWIIGSDGQGLRQLAEGEYPSWSPVDDWIAHRGCYGADCGLWMTQADSGERRRLTTGGGDGQPAWSPDGKWLAYISKDDGNFEIYKVGRDGSGKTRLTDTPQSDGLPVWSPDGKWIAFRSDRDGKWAIYVMPAAGGNPASGATKVVDADVLPLWFWEKMAWRP